MRQHQDFIQKLAECAAACEYCSDQCLNEDDIAKMADCIRTDHDCADSCHVAINFVARGSSHAKEAVRFCQTLCKACADECDKHEAQHCKACAEACWACEEACKQFLG